MRRTRPRPVLAAALLALAIVLAGGVPADAHEGDGIVTVENVLPEGTAVSYTVRVTWQNDGHPAADATVTATPVQPDGTALTPVPLIPDPAGDGRYGATVDFPEPGTWTVRFTSINPTGTAEAPQEVAASATTATSEPTAGTDEDPGASTTAADDDQASAASTESGDGDGSGGTWLAVALVVVLVAAALLAWWFLRSRRPGADATSTTAEPEEEPSPN